MSAMLRLDVVRGAVQGVEVDPDTGEVLDRLTARHADNKRGRAAAKRDAERKIRAMGFGWTWQSTKGAP